MLIGLLAKSSMLLASVRFEAHMHGPCDAAALLLCRLGKLSSALTIMTFKMQLENNRGYWRLCRLRLGTESWLTELLGATTDHVIL